MPTTETGINLLDTEFGLLVFIGFFLLAAVNEGTGKFVDE
jgi:photosystem II protein